MASTSSVFRDWQWRTRKAEPHSHADGITPIPTVLLLGGHLDGGARTSDMSELEDIV